MKQFDRQTLKVLEADMQKALEQVASKHNINLRVGNMRFSAEKCDVKVEAKILTGDGAVKLGEYDLLMLRLGLKCPPQKEDFLAERLKQPIKGGDGKMFTVVGYNIRKRSAPVQLLGTDGRSYSCPCNYIATFNPELRFN